MSATPFYGPAVALTAVVAVVVLVVVGLRLLVRTARTFAESTRG